MPEWIWLAWIAGACAALVVLAVLAGRYTASLFTDATRSRGPVEPGPFDPNK